MKLVCECGNEMEFIFDSEGDDEESIDEKGKYVLNDPFKFEVWSAHDEAGIVCKKCEKSIWLFT